jgi:hypothetical protein
MNIDQTKRVNLYRNLNKPGVVFSVQQSGKVVDWVESACIRDVRFKHASAVQLERCRTGAREVCQWVSGIVCEQPNGVQWIRLCGNVKTANGIIRTDTGARIDSADYVRMDSTGCYAGFIQ